MVDVDAAVDAAPPSLTVFHHSRRETATEDLCFPYVLIRRTPLEDDIVLVVVRLHKKAT